ncbi:MAG: hypothetical protein FWC41_07300 [Firmicutes bacterium]|nr:hypothetical protein [Bacillota bacterium]MCL2312275.1 hypothetical protein [Bacillota bacterium]
MKYLKYLLSKSINIIVINLFMGTFITLFMSNFVIAFKMAQTPSDMLSKNYGAISIGFDKNKIEQKGLHLSNLINLINKESTPITILKIDTTSAAGVFSNTNGYTPDLISGRGFTIDDFSNKTNTVLISESLLSMCANNGGKQYYSLNNQNFEIIGVYKKSTNLVNLDSSIYYNLNSENITRGFNSISGIYHIDAKNKTIDIIQKIDNLCSVILTKNPGKLHFSENFKKALSTQKGSVLIFILIIAMVTLSSISISINWLESRRREFFIRKLVGGYKSKINKMLIKDFWFIITLSFFLSSLLSVTISKLNMDIFVGFNFDILTMISSYLFIIFLGTITILLTLIFYNRESRIVKMAR